jgi:preprotein translocase subunit SecD
LPTIRPEAHVRRSYIVSLALVTIAAITALVSVLAAGWAPVLGVQLQGGVEVVLRPTSDVSDEQLDRAIEIIRSRVDALGVAEPDITRQGDQVVIQLPGVKDRQRAVDLVGQTAELRFRPVQLPFDAGDAQARSQMGDLLEVIAAQNAAVAGDTATDDAAPEEGTTTIAPSITGEPATTTTAPPSTTVAPTTTTAPPSTTAAPATTAADGAGGAEDTVPTTAAPDEATPPTTTVFDPDTAPSLQDIITPPEDDLADAVVLLPGKVENNGSQLAYILGPAELTGEVVSDANANFQGNQWVVDVELTSEGSDAFDAMAAQYFGQQVAIVLDGVVESAPSINATEFGGVAVISGTFTEGEAKDLALVLRFGALPVEFEQDDVRTVSATLGEGTLQAGVVAGIVGLVLVALYMILYYRLLGFVAVASLAVSGAILWSFIAWLGQSRGLALTLAGITGIIVSIGVQVDSNIVYYERLRDEVKRGRAVRSAADGSFGGAFRTIVWADLASLIGAGVLYYLTTGTVRGFALFLGITTIIDIFVSYFFMRPLVVLVARRIIGENPSRIGVVRPTEEVAS